jgi:hypothetical protein
LQGQSTAVTVVSIVQRLYLPQAGKEAGLFSQLPRLINKITKE